MTREEDANDSTYYLKWIPWNTGKIPIVMQSKNGPCPLIATMNVLLLREKVKLSEMLEQITANQLLAYLGECLMDQVPSTSNAASPPTAAAPGDVPDAQALEGTEIEVAIEATETTILPTPTPTTAPPTTTTTTTTATAMHATQTATTSTIPPDAASNRAPASVPIQHGAPVSVASSRPEEHDENAILNIEQNIHDAIEILPKLKTGLDVNIRFTGITDFEYTPECIIFDFLRIPLYHGWLCDRGFPELRDTIGSMSYNQLVDFIITHKSTSDSDVMARVSIAEDFLAQTASQLTIFGLQELKDKIRDNEIGILFRNNHFLTLFKRDGEIYTLVTDHGYLTEDNIIWETLDSIEGAGRFFDSNFEPSDVTNRQLSEFQAIDKRKQQLENDLLMALSLNDQPPSG